jgi:hypothetical protein
MARAKSTANGRLEEALAALAHEHIALMRNQTAMMQNQTALLARIAQTDTRIAETDTRLAELERVNSERFARIEALLLEHHRMLEALPEAVRVKIGFKPPGT